MTPRPGEPGFVTAYLTRLGEIAGPERVGFRDAILTAIETIEHYGEAGAGPHVAKRLAQARHIAVAEDTDDSHDRRWVYWRACQLLDGNFDGHSPTKGETP